MKAHRVARVSEVIREVAAETILFELQDPRIKGVTVTRAEVSADLQTAKVYVSIMGSDKEQDLCMHGLRHSSGFVQSRLGSRLKTRFTPTITFIKDEGVKKSIEVTAPYQRSPGARQDRGNAGNHADGRRPRNERGVGTIGFFWRAAPFR